MFLINLGRCGKFKIKDTFLIFYVYWNAYLQNFLYSNGISQNGIGKQFGKLQKLYSTLYIFHKYAHKGREYTKSKSNFLCILWERNINKVHLGILFRQRIRSNPLLERSKEKMEVFMNCENLGRLKDPENGKPISLIYLFD